MGKIKRNGNQAILGSEYLRLVTGLRKIFPDELARHAFIFINKQRDGKTFGILIHNCLFC